MKGVWRKAKGGNVEVPANSWSMVTMSSVTWRKSLHVDFLPDTTVKNSDQYTRCKYTQSATDPALNFLSTSNGTGEKLKTKLATEGDDGQQFHGGEKSGHNERF